MVFFIIFVTTKIHVCVLIGAFFESIFFRFDLLLCVEFMLLPCYVLIIMEVFVKFSMCIWKVPPSGKSNDFEKFTIFCSLILLFLFFCLSSGATQRVQLRQLIEKHYPWGRPGTWRFLCKNGYLDQVYYVNKGICIWYYLPWYWLW